MRPLLLFLLCAGLTAQNPAVNSAAPCSVSGKVVSADTGRPVADAKVRLQPTAQASAVSFVTLSDDVGEFAFANIEPGAYAFSVERAGYVRLVYGARRSNPAGDPVRLAAGENRSGFELKMAPQAVIAGRVVGPDGEPNRGVQVSAMRIGYASGKRQLIRVGGMAMPNDLGEFRVTGLPAGRYYLAASPMGAGSPTYFPSTTDDASARAVEVAAGNTVSNIEIREQPTLGFRVHARVANQTGYEFPNGSITAWIPLASGSLNTPVMFGEFSFNNVPRGNATFVLSARGAEGQIDSQFVVPVNGPEEVSLTLNAPLTISGKVSVEGGPLPKALKASLDPVASISTLARQGEVAEDGSFMLRFVAAGSYYASVAGLPPSYYVKSIRLGEADGLDEGLALTEKPGPPLEIVLGANAATVRGSVSAPGSGATVVLVPQSAKRRARAEFYRTSAADSQGKYMLASVPPGDYSVFAWQDVESGAWMDPDFLKPVEAQGKPITLRGGQTAELDLKAIP
jgi:hypothetical protein